MQEAHVLITGASRGIGAAMAAAFASAGARVSMAARSLDALTDVAAPFGGLVHQVDLTDPAQTDDLIDRVQDKAGPIDVLVNNAGIEEAALFHEVDVDLVRTVSRLNLEAPMVLTRQVLPTMIERDQGHLVFTSSLAGTAGFPGLAAYGATKAGLLNFAAALRIELRDTDIDLTVVSPGPVDTDMWDAVGSAPGLESVLDRLNMLKLLPIATPTKVAERTVEAVRFGRRHVRTPRRLAPNFWLREAASRTTELLLRGVDVGPNSR